VETPKPLEALRLEPPKIEIPARPTIKQDVFPLNTAPAVSPDAPPKAVRTGGFGNPNGASPSASTNKGFAAPAVGAFDSPAGSAVGKSQSGSGKLVASAGFGGVSQGPAAGSEASHGSVHGAGFGDYDQSVAPPKTSQTARAAAPAETPVEIIFKPKPAYTAEAREKKIEGEVLLEVQFGSDGQIRVLHLLHGLGYGLDENARAAAGQIRFHPGTRNGTPVDVTGTVHISFELS
jgi:TonB family protein